MYETAECGVVAPDVYATHQAASQRVEVWRKLQPMERAAGELRVLLPAIP